MVAFRKYKAGNRGSELGGFALYWKAYIKCRVIEKGSIVRDPNERVY